MVKVRNYRDSDYEDLKRNLQDGNMFDPIWDTRENLQGKIEKNPDSIIVAEKDNMAIGNIFIVSDGWSSFLFRFAVRKEYRGNGIGKLLLEEAENRVRKNGDKEVSIFVEEKLESLKKYYEKQGYVSTKNYTCMFKKLIS